MWICFTIVNVKYLNYFGTRQKKVFFVPTVRKLIWSQIRGQSIFIRIISHEQPISQDENILLSSKTLNLKKALINVILLLVEEPLTKLKATAKLLRTHDSKTAKRQTIYPRDQKIANMDWWV